MQDFPQLTNSLYLDNAGSVPIPSPILLSHTKDLMSNIYGNTHSGSTNTSAAIQRSRTRILKHLNTDESEYSIVFTSGATAALKLLAETYDWKSKSFYYQVESHTSVVGMSTVVSQIKNMPVEQCCFAKEIKNLENKKGLVAIPAQCNFSGKRFDMSCCRNDKEGVHVLVDAASYCSSSSFDLKRYPADYMAISFYKMFGFPTGIGALIVKNTAIPFLQKSYFGGGTVESIGVEPLYYSQKSNFYERMEDGTLPFHQILALQHGFDYIENRFGTWSYLKDCILNLTDEAYNEMKNLKHYNGAPVVHLYSDFLNDHGPIIAFNLLNPDGSYVGYSQVSKLAETEKLGHVCGDEMDIVDGKPTGAVRISFGLANSLKDVKLWLKFLTTYFQRKKEMFSLTVPTLNDIIKIEISKMVIYPIKSCPGIEVANWHISKTGLLYDRYFMLTDLQGKALTLKKYPKLGQLNIKLAKNMLTITGKQLPPLVLPMDESKADPLIALRVCKFTVEAEVTNELANKWFSEYLGQSCKLLRNRAASGKSFANNSQYLLTNDSSLDFLLSEIGSGSHVNFRSFRPNLCIKNQPEFVEESWVGKFLEYHGQLFKVDALCERCQMVCIDSQGNRHKEPLCTLAKRPRRNGKIIFGVHLTLVSSANEQIEI
ncbi:hypothetical protein HDV01_005045 [Terramyces sp. JEL0728]|nr:hypothetical protein HDV01_005045 [Terramyces sp. JEL0728]